MYSGGYLKAEHFDKKTFRICGFAFKLQYFTSITFTKKNIFNYTDNSSLIKHQFTLFTVIFHIYFDKQQCFIVFLFLHNLHIFSKSGKLVIKN